MRRSLPFILVLATMASAAACGGKTATPTGPSTTGSGSPAGPSTSGPTATVTGSVQASAIGVTVSVLGTSISTAVDSASRFALVNVPAGDISLQLTGGGANATVSLGIIQPSETVDLVVTVAGLSASIDSQVKSGAGQAELEGRVESLPPTMPALTFKAAGRTVRTDSSTKFVDGSLARTFADLQIGMRVHVKGSLSGDTFTATLVELQNSHVAVPVEVNGTIDSLTGSPSAFQFKIGSRLVKGDAATVFFGDGDKSDTFSDLKNNARVEVKGEQRDGFVYATRIHINGTETTPTPPEDSASIHGSLNSLTGTKPALLLIVGTTTVRTSSGTEVKRRGDVQTLDTLKLGQTLHVVGDRQSDGSINARLIEIDDDAAGGEFEIEGSLGGLKGTCPSVAFGVNGFSVTTSASTTFEGATCQELKSGNKVTVKGTRQADGSVAATRVKKT